jgi:hypothetical protein
MPTATLRRPVLTVLALAALFLTFLPSPASAGTIAPTGASYQSAEALYACEEKTARGTLGDLRDCVYDLVAPDPTKAEIFDLWRIFMDCLSLMSDAGPDAMYPTSHYEDKVNDCLGL